MSAQHTPGLVQERDAFKARLAEQQGELSATKLELSRLRSISHDGYPICGFISSGASTVQALTATHWACQRKTL